MAVVTLKYFTQILSVISQFNFSEQDLLKAAKMNTIPTTERLDAAPLALMLNFASRELNDPLFGIKCAQTYPVLQYTRPAEFLKLCENLEQAAGIYNRYCPLFHTIGKPSPVLSESGQDRMVWTPNLRVELLPSYRQFIELILTNFLTSINWLAWKIPNAVQQINFKHEAAGPLGNYQNLLGCVLKFGQAEYSLILKPGVKHAPFATSDAAALTAVCVRYDTALNELRAAESIIDRVELQIRLTLPQEAPKKMVIAKALGMSERSMARALKEKGTRFKDIKTRVLQDLAITMLNQGLPLIEIAHSLGYSDQPAFTRAYKKWFGHPPGRHKTASAREVE